MTYIDVLVHLWSISRNSISSINGDGWDAVGGWRFWPGESDGEEGSDDLFLN